MLENKVTQENSLRSEKIGQTSINRPPLRTLSFENIPSITSYQCQNPQQLKCYFDEIFSFLCTTEEAFSLKSDYFQHQSEITHTSRAFLIDWLVGVHAKFRLMQETLYITVNLIDRYLSKRMVTKKQLQLVGLTAIFIASKYEEIYPPNLKDFLIAADQAYTKQHLVKMEIDMLKVVDFQITFPTAWRFMEKYPEFTQNTCGALHAKI